MILLAILFVALAVSGVAAYFLSRSKYHHWTLRLLPWGVLVAGIWLLLRSVNDASLSFGGVLLSTYVIIPAAIAAIVGGAIGRWK